MYSLMPLMRHLQSFWLNMTRGAMNSAAVSSRTRRTQPYRPLNAIVPEARITAGQRNKSPKPSRRIVILSEMRRGMWPHDSRQIHVASYASCCDVDRPRMRAGRGLATGGGPRAGGYSSIHTEGAFRARCQIGEARR